MLFFTVLADHFSGAADWSNVHYFWVDERMVPSVSPESNYMIADQHLFQKISVPEENIHRIMGENDPSGEVIRYASEIRKYTPERNGYPLFDVVILGLGEDGHTASIFPGDEKLFRLRQVCYETMHPQTGQKRITISGKMINNAAAVYFLVAGKNTATVVNTILGEKPGRRLLPASRVSPSAGSLYWFLDGEAASEYRKNEAG